MVLYACTCIVNSLVYFTNKHSPSIPYPIPICSVPEHKWWCKCRKLKRNAQLEVPLFHCVGCALFEFYTMSEPALFWFKLLSFIPTGILVLHWLYPITENIKSNNSDRLRNLVWSHALPVYGLDLVFDFFL